jgi:putative serine protease PepD
MIEDSNLADILGKEILPMQLPDRQQFRDCQPVSFSAPFPLFKHRSSASQSIKTRTTSMASHRLPGHTLSLHIRRPLLHFVPLFLLVALFVTGCTSGGSTTTSNAQNTNNAGSSPAQSDTTNPDALRESVIAKVQPSVVQINVKTAKGGGLGSGVIIDKRGYIITNNHVVEGAQQMQVVLYGDETVPGQIIGLDPPDDLAVIKITPPTKISLAVATLGDSSKLRVGQSVLAIGNPLGITQTVTSGIVSALNRQVETIPDAIQTDAAINGGNSGGGLFDLQSNLVGVPTATAIDPQFKTPANGVGFAVPANRVKFIATQLIQSGKVINSGRAALGVNVASVDAEMAEQNQLPVQQGVLIANVTPGGPAAKAGLQSGDILVQIDGQPVPDVSTLNSIMLTKKPGDTVSLQFYRGSQQQTAKATLSELQIG